MLYKLVPSTVVACKVLGCRSITGNNLLLLLFAALCQTGSVPGATEVVSCALLQSGSVVHVSL